MNRTVIIGIDGVPFEYLDKFAADLPNVATLREAGVEAPLESTFPPWTPSAWPSIYTGKHPAEHGVHGFFTYDENDPTKRRVVSRNDVRAPAIWNYADDAGISSIVLNVPVTHPAESIDGMILPGYLAPASAISHPEDIDERLSDKGIKWQIYADEETGSDSDKKLESYIELIKNRARTTEVLLSDFDWRFAFVQVQKTDAVFHNFAEEEAFRRVYKAMDEVVGAVLASVDDDDTVVLVSDHGIQRVTGQTVYVNELLREHGLLSTTQEPLETDFKRQLIDDQPENNDENLDLASALVTLASRFGLTPGRVLQVFCRLGVDETIRELAPDSFRAAANVRPDYSNSQAYCRLGSEMGIRLNLEGRDPGGVIPKSEYDVVRDQVISCLSNAESSDGTPLFEFVDRYEVATGYEPTGDAPDVVFLPEDMNHTVSHRMPGVTSLPVDAYDHAKRGVFIAKGPLIEDAPASINAVAVAPMVLTTLSIGMPTELSNRVPEGLLTATPETIEKEVPYGSSSTNQSDNVTDRLEDLGYL